MTEVNLGNGANKFLASDEREDYYINGNGGNDTLAGNEGNDTIVGGKGNDSLKGNEGDDVFVYNNGDGNDVIADYENNDKISIVSAAVTNITNPLNTKDIVLTITGSKTGKITVQGGYGKTITYVDDYGEHTYPDSVYELNSKGTAVTLLANYNDDEFKTSDIADYANTIVTIDASAVDQDLEITANKKNNKIYGGQGNDEIDGGKGNDTIEGGTGNDTLYGGAGADVFAYNRGDGNDTIADYEEEDKINIVGNTVSKITKSNGNVILTLDNKKKITIIDGADKVISYTDENGSFTYPEVTDTVEYNKKGTSATLTADYTKDEYKVAEDETYASTLVTVDGSALDQDISIVGNKKNNVIIGGAGNDTLDGGTGNDNILGGAGADLLLGGKGADTLEGGTGNDTLTGGAGADVFVYNYGDGNDVITDYEEEDTIQIVGDTVSKITKKNSNMILTLASKKKITIMGGEDKVISYTDDSGEHAYPEIVKFNTKGTAVTLTADYNKDEFNIADYADYASSVVTIDASATDQDVKITANKKNNYIVGGQGNDEINGGKGNDTIAGGTGNDTLYGGAGADVFVYNNGDGKDVIADYTEDDFIQINDDAVAKVSKKNGNAILTLESKKTITVLDAADKVLNYTGAVVPVEFNAKGTGATLSADYTDDEFDIADYSDYANSVVTIDASALDQDIEITGNKKNNRIYGGAGNDEIDGGAGNDYLYGNTGADTLEGGKGDDTLEGGAGNDKLYGGAGADVFVYNNGDGNDTIADYEEEDSIQIVGDTVAKTTIKNGNVIFTLESKKKITITDGADKVISYSDSKGENSYPQVVKFNTKGTVATLTANYVKDEFNIADYDEYADSVVTINAAKVEHDLSIIGNKKANVITGSANNDTLWGNKGNDTLYGGDGADTFVYQNGDGKDIIADFDSMDQIMLYSGTLGGYSASGSDVTFKVGSGSITVKDGADKYIEVVDSSGAYVSHYSPKG